MMHQRRYQSIHLERKCQLTSVTAETKEIGVGRREDMLDELWEMKNRPSGVDQQQCQLNVLK